MRIYVVYHRTNRSLVSELVADLEDMEHEVHLDERFEDTQAWWDECLKHLRLCDAAIFAITPEALEAYGAMVQVSYAHSLKKPFISVSLSIGVEVSRLPLLLKEHPVVDYARQDKIAYKTLRNTLNRLPEASSLPDPQPEPPEMPVSPLRGVREELSQPNLTHDRQIAILHQLKGFLSNPQYIGEARELLERLAEHPMLLASVLRSIFQTLDEAPKQEPLVIEAPATPALSAEEPTPSLPQPSSSNDKPKPLSEELPKDTWKGKWVESVVGVKDGLWYIGTKDIVFTPNESNEETITIDISDIAQVRMGWKLLRRVVYIETKTKQEYAIILDDNQREAFIQVVNERITQLTTEQV